MDKQTLRSELSQQLWKLSGLEIMTCIRELAEGETAALMYLYQSGGGMTPSDISKGIKVSRPRVTNILRVLRRRGYVEMIIADDDRRKMIVNLTKEGQAFMRKKMEYMEAYLDLYIDEMGEENVKKLTEILKITIDCQSSFAEKLQSLPKDS